MCRKCVDPSTPLRSARDDMDLASRPCIIKKPAPGIPGTVLQEPYSDAEAFVYFGPLSAAAWLQRKRFSKVKAGGPIQRPQALSADRFRSRPEEAAPSPGPPGCPGIRLGNSSRKCPPLALYKFSFIVYNGGVIQVLPLTPLIIHYCMKLCNRRIGRFV